MARKLTKHLIQDGTERIYVWTKKLAERADMKPYTYPEKKENFDDEKPVTALKSVVPPGIDKAECEQLCLDWFEKDMSKVTKKMLESYALSKFKVDIDRRQTKLNIIQDIKELFKAQGGDVESFLKKKEADLNALPTREAFLAYAMDNFSMDFDATATKPEMVKAVLECERKRFLGE